MSWQTVLGFEIHIELSTSSKMFCGCPADHFGKSPNTQTCPVCLGLPGALPVPNAKAIESCIKLGLALNCQINLFSKFDRKNYFYPDLPKGYQISQYDLPFCFDGHLLGHKIIRVHLEEDTGKLQHAPSATLIDFNRSGVPLVEVVTEADFKDSEDSDQFLKELRRIVRALNISTADMEKGSMRLEANISVKDSSLAGFPPYKVEIKNVNSFRFVKKAIDHEVNRQTKLLESGTTPIQETRGFKEATGETFSQRTKEEAHDYRYFPEPDIPPLRFTTEQIDIFKSQLPKLPSDVRKELAAYDLPDSYISVLIDDTDLLQEFMKNPSKQSADMLINKRPPKETSYIPEAQIKAVAEDVISKNPTVIKDYLAGKTQVLGFLIGQIKKQLPTIDPSAAKKILENTIN